MNVQQKIVCQGTKLDDTNTIHVKSAVTLVSLLHVCLSVCLSAVQGILTGVSRGGFSLSINERDLGGDPIVDALEAVLRHAYSPTHLARKVSLISDLPWSCILRPFPIKETESTSVCKLANSQFPVHPPFSATTLPLAKHKKDIIEKKKKLTLQK